MIKVKRNSDCSENDITPEHIYKKRREFMKSGSILGAGLLLNGLSGCTDIEDEIGNINPDVTRTNEELTDFKDATSYNNFYEFGTNKGDAAKNSGNFHTDNWQISVSGNCQKTGEFLLQDIIEGLDVEDRIYRLRCVETWSMIIPWQGISLASILQQFKPDSSAKYVAFKTLFDPKRMPGQKRAVIDWPYIEGLRIDEAMNPLTILATGMYGKTMPNQNGAPIRLVVPWKYGFKSIKSIVSIEFTEKQPDTTWNLIGPNEYGFYSNVNPQVSHPRWSQARERKVGEFFKHKTLMFNGYADEVASMYSDMDLKKYY